MTYLLIGKEIVETFETVDYFSDAELITDPYPYFNHLRGQCPVLPGGPAGVVTVTGHEEAVSAYKNPAL